MKQKFKPIHTAYFALFLGVLFISFSGNPPNGRTGAPGELTCADGCHNNSNPNGFAGTIDIVNFPSSITPNTTYNLQATVNFTASSPNRAGFQAVALDGSDINIGDFMTTDPNVSTVTASGREYVEHSPALTFGGGTSVTYNFDWVSPSGSNGEVVTIYTASVIANGANGNSGDLVITNTVSGTISGGGGSPPSISASSTDADCFGTNTGTASAFANGGTPGYMYNWSNGSSGANIFNLGAGNYTVTVTDNAGQTASATTTVNQPSQVNTFITNQIDIDCFGNNNGSASASATGGTGGFTFMWSNGMSGSTINNLAAGTYTVTAVDVNNCTNTSNVTISQPNAISITVAPNNISCNGTNDGSASAFGNGGAGGFNYAWSNGMSGQTISNLSAGTYTVTAVDANNCIQTSTTTITEPNAILINIAPNNISCNSANDGSASAFANGGAGGFSYAWSNGMSGQTISNLSAGTYTVTAVDNNNCIQTSTTTITEPNAINLTASGGNISCNSANDGTASATANGGAGGFNYSWSNGATGQNISNLAAGTYTVSAVDNNNCIQTETITITEPSPIFISINTNNVSCNGINDGSASATATGGVAGFSYSWSNGVSGQTINNLSAGTYTVTAVDANNCINIESITITEPSAININTSQIDITCNGANDGVANAFANGGVGNLTYNWSNGATGQTIVNLAAGVYTVTVTDANNCNNTSTFIFDSPPVLNLTANFTNISCAGFDNGTATATGSGGAGNFTYLWSNNLSTATITNLFAGTYTVTVTDANGCTNEESVTISEPLPIFISFFQNNISCNGANDGSASANASGGTGNLSYDWSNGATGANVSNLAAGTYTLTITDANGCTQSETITITEPNAISVSISQNNITCNGLSDGSASASATGGTGNLNYSWSTGATSPTINNLSPGTYTVVATDMNGCTQSETVNISEPNAITISIFQNDITCNGDNDGSASASATGGTGNLNYSWSNNATGQSINNLAAGTYTCTTTDANGCTQSQSVTINEPTLLLANTSSTGETSAGANDGTATSTPSGGIGNYAYNWSNGATMNMITGLAPGTYTVTITDDNNCTVTESVVVNAVNCAISADATGTNPACFGDTGSATVNASNGTGPFNYNWSNGATSQTITDLLPGTYTVTIVDNSNCPASATVIITTPDELMISAVPTNVSCFGQADGSINVTGIGGTPPYMISLPNGTGTDLTPGNYNITITDANNCITTEMVTITEPSEVLVSNFQVNDVTCFGNSNGSAIFDVLGGSPPYTFFWQTPNGSGNGLPAGSYSVVIEDSNGCLSISIPFTVTQPTDPLTVNTSASPVSSVGANDGLAGAFPSGGTQPYSYSWSNGATTSTISNLAPGNYTVTVMDANNCTSFETVIINDINCTITATTTSVDVLCFGDSNGSASVTVAAGVMPFVYNWSNGSTNPAINNITAGVYTVTVTDANNCPFVETITITEPTQLAISQGNQSNVTLNCFGDSNGFIDANISGGTMPYTYAWSNTTTGNPIANIPSGTYTVTVTDANDCSESMTFTITQPDELIVNATSTDETMANGNDGTASATASGGTGNYTYNWSNGLTMANLTGLAPGSYMVTVTDDNNCETIEMVDVLAFGCTLAATSIANDATCSDATDGSIVVTATGGDEQYTYNWSSGGTAAIEENLLPGTYTVTINDGNNCQWIETANVGINDNIAPIVVVQDVTIAIGPDGFATLNPVMLDDGSTDNCSAVILTADMVNFTCDQLGDNTVTLTVTDMAGNESIGFSTVTVIDIIPPTIVCPTDIVVDACTGMVTYGLPMVDDNCGNTNTTIVIQGPLSGTIFPFGTTVVTIIATDASNNQSQCEFSVNINHTLDLTTTSLDSPCAGDNMGTATADATGSNPGFIYLWSNGAMTADIDNLAPGTYTVTVTDLANCTSTNEVTILEPTSIGVAVDNITNESSFGAGDGAIEVTVSGGTPPFSYEWLLNGNVISTDEDPTGLEANDYILNVSDANGCLFTSSVITIETTVSSEDLILEKNIRLFPNPVSDEIYLDFTLPRSFDFEIMIHDATGKVVLTRDIENVAQQKLELNVSNFASGLFFVKIKTEEGIWVRKFIVQ